jgi:hypothetical protein
LRGESDAFNDKRRDFSTCDAVALGFSASACAQAARTFVSGVGDDANPCSRTAPCRSFAGEVDVLGPGGFGVDTITKAITIDGGAVGHIAGTRGILVSAGGTDTVILRNLDFNGMGTELSGIVFQYGATLVVENSTISGFTGSGIQLTSAGNNQFFGNSSDGVLSQSGECGYRRCRSAWSDRQAAPAKYPSSSIAVA